MIFEALTKSAPPRSQPQSKHHVESHPEPEPEPEPELELEPEPEPEPAPAPEIKLEPTSQTP